MISPVREWLLLLALVAACGARSASPGSAAVAWREVTSEHFVVWTNASPERARVLVRTMENLRQVLLSFFKTEVKGKTFVVAFNDLDEVHQYVEEQFIAKAWPARNVLLQPVIVLAAESVVEDRAIVTHELTHVISFHVIPNQPSWFAEGLAEYFETVRLDENRATLDVGRPRENRIRQLHIDGLTPISTLFACDASTCKDDRFYATSWALVTYMLTNHQQKFFQYMGRLNATPEEQHPQLWAQVFPDLPPKKLDRELATYVHYGHVSVMKYNIALREWPVTERPISEADALAAKGLLRYLTVRKPETPKEIERALGLDATNVMANMIDAVAKKAITSERAATLTTAHPNDWRAWWLAWRAAQNGAESREAKEKTCTLLEANPAAVPIEACARDEQGRFAEDARSQVFMTATPQLNECLKQAKGALAAMFSIEIDIADTGAVSAVRASVGSAETNACVEQVLRGLVFPPNASGTFRMNTPGPKR